MLFFLLVTFTTALQLNIQHFLVNRISEPFVTSKMAIALELKLCLSNLSREIETQKEGCQGTIITSISYLQVIDFWRLNVIIFMS